MPQHLITPYINNKSANYRASPGEVPDTEVTVRGLVEGKPYEFRVAAVNEAGPGEWVETDSPIKPAPPPSEYLNLNLRFSLLQSQMTIAPGYRVLVLGGCNMLEERNKITLLYIRPWLHTSVFSLARLQTSHVRSRQRRLKQDMYFSRGVTHRVEMMMIDG